MDNIHDHSDFSIEYADKVNRISNEIISYLDNMTFSNDKDTTLISSIDNFVTLTLPPIKNNGKEMVYDQKLDVDSKKQLFSLAFCGFAKTNLSYVATDISRDVLKANNGFKYHINNEDWLIHKIMIAKLNNDFMDLPEVVIFPKGYMPCSDLMSMLLDENIPIKGTWVTTGVPTKEVLCVDKGNNEYTNSINKIETDIMQVKVDKYIKYYTKLFNNIDNELDKLYGIANLEYDGKTNLYLRSYSSGKKTIKRLPNDINYLTDNLNNNLNDDILTGKNVQVHDIEKSLTVLNNKMNSLMQIIMEVYKDKDIATFNHISGMLGLVDVINKGLGDSEKLSKQEIERLKKMVILHDIGKLVIPKPILDKSGVLTDNEKSVMNSHVYERNICLVRNKFINSILSSALLHHVGNEEEIGYADENIKNRKKDKLTQILSVLDVYDALTGIRPYKKSKSPEVAIDIMCEDVFDKKMLQEYYVRKLIDGLGLNQSLLYDKNQIQNNSKNINLNEDENYLNNIKGMGK